MNEPAGSPPTCGWNDWGNAQADLPQIRARECAAAIGGSMTHRNFGRPGSRARPLDDGCRSFCCSPDSCYWPECTQPELRPTERDPTFWIIAGVFLTIFVLTYWGL